MSVVAELRRRNVFRVAALYGLAAWLTLQVADVLIPALGLPGWVQRLVALLLILGFPLVLIFAWAYELTPDGLKKQHEVDRVPSNSHDTGRKLNHLIGALAALAIAVVVVDRLLPEKPSAAATGKAGAAALNQPGPSVAASPPSAVPMNSIAVLPFVNMSSDPEQEYFSDGLAEELLNLLAKLPELRVIGRTSSFQFKGRNEDLRVIGEKLNVAHILEGSVRKSGQKVRITAQLVRSADGSHLWSETYDRTLEDIFAVQDDIAAQVVKALEVTLLRGNSSVPARAPDVEAYNLFLQGRYFAQRQSPEDSKRAIPYLQRSLDLDPSYAPAWVELANVHMTQADYGWIPSAEAYSRAREAVHQALVLDPNLASAHSALGWIQSGIDRDWTAAEKSMRKALALEPGNPEVLTRTGLAVAGMGRLEEGLGLLEKALERDPLRLDSLDYRAYVLTSMGRFDEAVAVSRKVFELDPSRGNAGFGIGLPLLLKGELDAALQQMEGETTESWRLFGLSLVYHSLGRRADSDAELARLKQKYAGEMAYRIAETHAWRGENDLAFEWLDRAYDQQEAVLADIKLSQLVRRLSNDPRYRIFLKKMNLPA